MLSHKRLSNQLRQWLHGGKTPIWYDPAYRLPLPLLSSQQGIESRRADYAIWYLLDMRLVKPESVLTPGRIRYSDISRVHSAAHIESLCHEDRLAQIFAVDPEELPVDEVIRTVRLACGGTLAAARESLKLNGPSLNLLGGFHHAEPNKAGGLCPLNDIAIAIAALRFEGFTGKMAVLDLDAHPPDGTAACLVHDRAPWIGSISGCDWGAMDNVDETVLRPGTGDHDYHRVLDGLLSRMPKVQLTFVIAGGDVLAEDRMGNLALSLEGAKERDRRVRDHLSGQPSVWLPGGGYNHQSWKVLANTAALLEGFDKNQIPKYYAPLGARYSRIAQSIRNEDLEGDTLITASDIYEALGMPSPQPPRFMDYYTIEGLEYALSRYGILETLTRLGYDPLRIEVKKGDVGQHMRIYGHCKQVEHVLVDLMCERQKLEDGSLTLYVHWLSLTNPISHFSEKRPRLPGQETPGLGIAKESAEMLIRMAKRLHLQGVAFRPSWYHIAFAARHKCYFENPTRQGRFRAMVRDLKKYPLLTVTQSVADGKVLMNGEPYHWEPDLMVQWLDKKRFQESLINEEKERVSFTISPS